MIAHYNFFLVIMRMYAHYDRTVSLFPSADCRQDNIFSSCAFSEILIIHCEIMIQTAISRDLL